MTSGTSDWTVATIQQAESQPASTDRELRGCLVQMSPTCDLRGPRELGNSTTSLGRWEGCDLVLPDASISRLHAEISYCDRTYEVRDLDSTNGTFVNDTPVTSRVLTAGDQLRVGNHLFKFLLANDIEAQYHEAVFSMMTRDGLTGTLNKRFLMDVLQRDIARARRSGSPLSLLVLDIDHFKLVNDTHGHLVGDEVLRQLARRIQSVIRAEDLFARYGGEEFVIALAQTDQETTVAMTERLRAAIADAPFATNSGDLQVTVSAGIAMLDEIEDHGMDALIQLADDRLYQAKRDGRNRVCS